jgi:tRNA threonylcarbamoyladenosine biosynthesis protein TsaB
MRAIRLKNNLKKIKFINLQLKRKDYLTLKSSKLGLILNIETATKTCSVALSQNGELLAIKEQHGEYAHAENLTSFIDELLSQTKRSYKDLDAIAVSKGPGSYTGLRIGVATAKGLCFALNIPLLAVNTLEAMANTIAANQEHEYLLCPMIDARRMEVYCAIFDNSLNSIMPTCSEIITSESFMQYAGAKKLIFFGDGAQKCKEILSLGIQNAEFISDFNPSASGMISLSHNLFEDKKFEDVAYFEPYYLKDFVTTTPKKII